MADRQRALRPAVAQFDAANAEDPNRDTVDGRARPKELLYAERLTAMLARFAPEADEPLRLAARCQHIERWKIPRATYPMTRAGYQQWRTRLRDYHAERAGAILRDAGYDAGADRARELADPQGSAEDRRRSADLEDVVALVFMESYLDEFVGSTRATTRRNSSTSCRRPRGRCRRGAAHARSHSSSPPRR